MDGMTGIYLDERKRAAGSASLAAIQQCLSACEIYWSLRFLLYTSQDVATVLPPTTAYDKHRGNYRQVMAPQTLPWRFR